MTNVDSDRVHAQLDYSLMMMRRVDAIAVRSQRIQNWSHAPKRLGIALMIVNVLLFSGPLLPLLLTAWIIWGCGIAMTLYAAHLTTQATRMLAQVRQAHHVAAVVLEGQHQDRT